MLNRQCSKCRQVKPSTDYVPYADGRRRRTCTECRNKMRVAYSPEQKRHNTLQQRYGISIYEWNRRFDKQGKRCALCKSLDPKHVRGFQTDHDHVTGKYRGILCNSCNTDIAAYERMKAMPGLRAYLNKGKLPRE